MAVARKMVGSLKGNRVGRKSKEIERDDYAGKVAAHVKQLRQAKGLTGRELAAKLGISHSTYYGYENGSSEFPVSLFPQLARALGVKKVELLP